MMLNLNKIKTFETELLEKVKNDQPDILEKINTSGKLEDEIKKKLIELIESLNKGVIMPSLDDLKKRIKSVKSTQKITKAMKMVAAAKLKKAQENAEKGRPYSEKLQNIILNLTKSISDSSNAPKLLGGNGKDKTYLCVVMTADRGLCGGFNSNICKLAKKILKKFLKEGKELKIITVGSKGHDQIKTEFGKYIIDKKSFKEKNKFLF